MGGGVGDSKPILDVSLLDTRTLTWSDASPMPGARFGAVAVPMDGLIYVIGGEDGSLGLKAYLDTVLVLDPNRRIGVHRQLLREPHEFPRSLPHRDGRASLLPLLVW